MAILTIQHKTLPDVKIISKGSDSAILVPRKGDKVDMGYPPASTVIEVSWQFGGGWHGESGINITVIVE